MSNVLVCVVGVVLYWKLRANPKAKLFGFFLLATGIASGIAAFGHHPDVVKETPNMLLLVSRALSHLALAFFAAGCFSIDKRLNHPPFRVTLLLLFVAMLVWLAADNIFIPVIIFGVLCHLIIGFITFSNIYKTDRSVAFPVLLGIMLNILSALVFTFTAEITWFVASDLSHLLMAGSLVALYQGFKRL